MKINEFYNGAFISNFKLYLFSNTHEKQEIRTTLQTRKSLNINYSDMVVNTMVLKATQLPDERKFTKI